MLNLEKNPDPNWADHDPYKTLVDAAHELEERGESTVKLIDAFLGVALTWSCAIFGPRAVSERLYTLAMKFEADADRMDRAERGTDGGH